VRKNPRIRGTFHNTSSGQNGELWPILPECPIPAQKIDIDNKARFRYRFGYWFRLIVASISGISAEADTQSIIFDSSASKKQILIFIFYLSALWVRLLYFFKRSNSSASARSLVLPDDFL